MYDAAADLINSGALPIEDNGSFQQLYQLCIPASPMDPTATFRKDFNLRTAACECITAAVRNSANRL